MPGTASLDTLALREPVWGCVRGPRVCWILGGLFSGVGRSEQPHSWPYGGVWDAQRRLPYLRVLLSGLPRGLGRACVAILWNGTNEAQEGEGKFQWWVGSRPLHCPGESGARAPSSRDALTTGILSLLSELLRVLPQGLACRAQRESRPFRLCDLVPAYLSTWALEAPLRPHLSHLAQSFSLPVCSAPATCCSSGTPSRPLPQGLCTCWAMLSPGTPWLTPSFPLRLCWTSPFQRGCPPATTVKTVPTSPLYVSFSRLLFSLVRGLPPCLAPQLREDGSFISFVHRSSARTGALPGSY